MRRMARCLTTSARHQASNILRFCAGRPIAVDRLGSATLGPDDVEIAMRFLKNRTAWNDTKLVSEYESAFAEWNNSKAAFSFQAARVALSAAIYALDLQPGDEVVLPGYTCVVVSNAFSFAGVVPVYCDIELDTWGPNVASVEARLTPRTRAVLIHHLYGLICRDYESILELAAKRGLRVIEDCAQATGAMYMGIKVGNRGDVGIFSSEQSKLLNTSQGGMVVTNNAGLAERIRTFQSHAPSPDKSCTERLLYTLLLNYYSCADRSRWWRSDLMDLIHGGKRLISTTSEEESGIRPANYGCRFSAPLAAIGLNQLEKLDKMNARRREGAKRWMRWCLDNHYSPPTVVPDSLPVYLRFPVLVEAEKKKNPGWAVRDLNVELGVWFVSHLHPSPVQLLGCPNATRAVRECVNFPTLLS